MLLAGAGIPTSARAVPCTEECIPPDAHQWRLHPSCSPFNADAEVTRDQQAFPCCPLWHPLPCWQGPCTTAVHVLSCTQLLSHRAALVMCCCVGHVCTACRSRRWPPTVGLDRSEALAWMAASRAKPKAEQARLLQPSAEQLKQQQRQQQQQQASSQIGSVPHQQQQQQQQPPEKKKQKQLYDPWGADDNDDDGGSSSGASRTASLPFSTPNPNTGALCFVPAALDSAAQRHDLALFNVLLQNLQWLPGHCCHHQPSVAQHSAPCRTNVQLCCNECCKAVSCPAGSTANSCCCQASSDKWLLWHCGCTGADGAGITVITNLSNATGAT